MVGIEELNEKDLKEASNFVDSLFPSVYEEEPGSLDLSASLFPELYEEYLQKTEIRNLKYWVAKSAGIIVGIIGLYNYNTDKDCEIWIGWFAVKSEFRKKGIGEKLFRFAVEKAREQGKSILNVYTSNDPEEASGVEFYEDHGFRLIGKEPWTKGMKESDEKLDKLFYQQKI